jgi:hypothetical protein
MSTLIDTFARALEGFASLAHAIEFDWRACA